MSWYYAQNGQRQGPISDGEFNTLIKGKVITPSTLVWQEGMAEWRPYGELAQEAAPEPQVEEVHEIAEELELDPLVMEERARPVSLSVNACVWRSCRLLRNHFMLCTGTTFLVYTIVVISQLLPGLGTIIGPLLNGPLMAGLLWFFLLLIRGEQASFSDGFAGFKRNPLQLAFCALFSGLAVTLCMLPGFTQIGIPEMIQKGSAPQLTATSLALLGLGAVAAIYLTVAWIFALPLIIDKGLDWRQAMRLSRRVATRHWWRLFLLLPAGGALIAIIMGGTVLALGILNPALQDLVPASILLLIEAVVALLAMGGVYCLLPIFLGALMYAYEDLFGAHKCSEAREPLKS